MSDPPVNGSDVPSHTDETGRCIVLVTPDGERSMNTYLGISTELTSEDVPDDIDEAQIAAAEWIYLEGYLLR